LDIVVLGYIGIVWPKEHSPEVWSVPPVTPCIYAANLNHSLNDNNVSCFTQKLSVAKFLTTRHVTNVLPRLKLLNAMTTFTPPTVFLIKSFTANKIYLHGARSGFEPELPVHIMTWTWNAGNKCNK